ncbi:MAG TPA: TIGR03435 family protein [Terracidiphilus sp.]|nr:TIGR03435 family protein [Terracidiphilus sp.]
MQKIIPLVLLCFAVTGSPAPSQTPTPQPVTAPAPLAWDAVSIKPHHALDNTAMMRMLPNGFEMQNMAIYSLLMNAFPVRSGDQIVGWPAWVSSDRFDLLAKMDTETTDALHALGKNDGGEHQRLMMREILEDRFALKYHIEKRVLPVYELVIAKHGSKLKVSAPDEQGTSMMSPGKLSAHRSPAGSLTAMLSGVVGRNIIDKTGLTGDYDIDLTWAWNDEPGSGDTGPSIFTALEEQLGLKLEPAKAPLDVVIIDHLERPSEN